MSKLKLQKPQRAAGMVHKRIAEIAKGCAGEHYEVLAKQNAFYAAWPDRSVFVRVNWKRYIDTARQILVGMLGDPKRPESEKEAIYGILLLDGAINPKKMAEPAKAPVLFKA